MNKVSGVASSRAFKKRFHRKNRSGQALIEYSLLVTMAVLLALGFLSTFNGIMRKGIFKFNAVLESELRTGEFRNPTNPQIWEN